MHILCQYITQPFVECRKREGDREERELSRKKVKQQQHGKTPVSVGSPSDHPGRMREGEICGKREKREREMYNIYKLARLISP